eukprot:Cvel_18542.t2-p1 / transcript=Cvel_18542.t2 / gene=Cvel_18542 / organism=Chromera_velia_CCMP2878 / gene_product=hypothetical protein / transcript_product=hypothetical protein / location=Cvel_scaffold1543:27488-28879(-) / protein_length=464 / sequence_SO=supercontig / SO=protein_coding / is_pseudo=false
MEKDSDEHQPLVPIEALRVYASPQPHRDGSGKNNNNKEAPQAKANTQSATDGPFPNPHSVSLSPHTRGRKNLSAHVRTFSVSPPSSRLWAGSASQGHAPMPPTLPPSSLFNPFSPRRLPGLHSRCRARGDTLSFSPSRRRPDPPTPPHDPLGDTDESSGLPNAYAASSSFLLPYGRSLGPRAERWGSCASDSLIPGSVLPRFFTADFGPETECRVITPASAFANAATLPESLPSRPTEVDKRGATADCEGERDDTGADSRKESDQNDVAERHEAADGSRENPDACVKSQPHSLPDAPDAPQEEGPLRLPQHQGISLFKRCSLSHYDEDEGGPEEGGVERESTGFPEAREDRVGVPQLMPLGGAGGQTAVSPDETSENQIRDQNDFRSNPAADSQEEIDFLKDNEEGHHQKKADGSEEENGTSEKANSIEEEEEASCDIDDDLDERLKEELRKVRWPPPLESSPS